MKQSFACVAVFCFLTACGGGGGGGNSSSNPAEAGANQSPNEETQVQLNGGQSAGSGGGVTSYRWDQTAGSGVTLSNRNIANPTFTAPEIDGAVEELLRFQLTVVGNDSETHVDSVDIIVKNTQVTLNGTVRFEHIPFAALPQRGLDYGARSYVPSRGVTVVAGVNCGASNKTSTNENGEFSLTVAAGQTESINICAEMVSEGDASWDVEVINNTNNRAQYAARFSLSTGLTNGSVGNLDLPSGWSDGSNAYTTARVSGPFAILDAVYEAIQKTVAVDAEVTLPALKINWSVDNDTSSGNISTGAIGTSHYRGSTGELYILGKADNDTDEFDSHVVIHEWGHYFEDRLSRSDSIGGSHSLGEHLDMRVAFGEGFGNALSGIVTDDPVYRDSGGSQQSLDFSNDVESNVASGWFSEDTMQSMLYDMYDSNSDGDDNLSLGWGPLYQTFVDPDYVGHSAATSIFPYLERLKVTTPSSIAAIDSFAISRGVNGSDGFAAGEDNHGSVSSNVVLPVYTEIPAGSPVTVCSNASQGVYNKLGNRRFATFQSGAGSSYNVVTSSSVSNSDTDVTIFLNGATRAILNSAGEENRSVSLPANSLFVVEITDYNYGASEGAAGDVCSTITITQN